MGDDLISVIDIARQHGKRKSTVFKVLKKLGITPAKHRNLSSKNQLVAYITQEEFRLVTVEMQAIIERDDAEANGDESEDFVSAEVGVFYLIQLEPKFDPGRFKLGFATGMSERLRHLRCSAPFATVLQSWPCRRLWEKTAIESVSANCEKLHTEIFRTTSLEEVMVRCERFFAIMPPSQSSAYDQAVGQG
ncbi:GIY-YIG nuclease family protein [Zavarzinella formosa]|uniref:GIY-YIG nuclease family protein n=1 Tax=Zavarzinella formosa TaxID=360055 RepID=UPI0002F61CDE|nr:GIY-YIG nuclease family protein [Zavarzinella formosa]